MPTLLRRLAAEALGTGALVVAVVGSGVMASRLTTDVGLQLLVNALATVAALGVLILTLSPVSGAHVNPAVTVVAAARRELPADEAAWYVLVQVGGGLVGVAVANVMFGLPAWQASSHHRSGAGQLLGEVIATAGLLLVIGALSRTGRTRLIAVAVPAWIGAAYFCTVSTAFANPAATVARSLTDTFAGIAPVNVPAFVVAQLAGAALGVALIEVVLPRPRADVPLDVTEVVHDSA